MHIDISQVRGGLSTVDFSDGITRDQIREQWPEMPQEAFLLLPSSKLFLSADQVLAEIQNAGARAQGEFAAADLDIPTDGAQEDAGPPAWGHSLTGTDHLVEGEGDYPGEANDIAGSSIETGLARGSHPE